MSRKKVPNNIRQEVTNRANNCCEYCQSHENYATQNFAIEHIIPISLGGKDETNNYALACHGCNWHKYNKSVAFDVVTGQNVPLFNPRTDLWAEHFAWNDNFLMMVGLTPVGRATVSCLQLNRSKLQNRRKIFFEVKLHPPKHTLK